MDTNKRVVISGYYGFNNTGDEAVLHSILQALREKCKSHKLDITVLSNKPEETSRQYNVRSINRWDIRQIRREIKNCHLLISGGGSLLQDVTSNKTIPYYLSIIKIAQFYNKKVVFYSQGYGPVNKWHNKYIIKRTLNKLDYIFVRDKNSKGKLIDIGVKETAITVAADPVLGMKANKRARERAEEYINKTSNKSKRIGIYLRSWEDDKKLIDKINILTARLDIEGYDMFFIPMQQPEDVEVLKGISSSNLSVHMVTEKLDIEEVFALTGQMDIVLGMRLHSLIMATAQAIPTVGLSYDPKVEDFMEMIGNNHCYNVNEFDPEDVIDSIKSKMIQLEKERKELISVQQLLVDKVYKPAKLIDKILT